MRSERTALPVSGLLDKRLPEDELQDRISTAGVAGQRTLDHSALIRLPNPACAWFRPVCLTAAVSSDSGP